VLLVRQTAFGGDYLVKKDCFDILKQNGAAADLLSVTHAQQLQARRVTQTQVIASTVQLHTVPVHGLRQALMAASHSGHGCSTACSASYST
jgi:hypothetical protein